MAASSVKISWSIIERRLAAVLLGPADAQPAVVADLADDLLVDRGIAELTGGRLQSGTRRSGVTSCVEVLPQLGPQPLLIPGQRDVQVKLLTITRLRGRLSFFRAKL